MLATQALVPEFKSQNPERGWAWMYACLWSWGYVGAGTEGPLELAGRQPSSSFRERDLLQGNKVESERVRLDTLLWLIHHTHTACAHTEMHINTHTKEGTALTQQARWGTPYVENISKAQHSFFGTVHNRKVPETALWPLTEYMHSNRLYNSWISEKIKCYQDPPSPHRSLLLYPIYWRQPLSWLIQ